MRPLINRILFLLFFISISCMSLHAQENQSYFLHTIEKGQSLYSISSMYGVSQSDIIQLNPGCEEKIYAGQTIRIPQKQKASKQDEKFHTIEAGETLYKLTTIYNVSAKAICEANPGLSAENFRIGPSDPYSFRRRSCTNDCHSFDSECYGNFSIDCHHSRPCSIQMQRYA